jgi:hypothetical protein
MQIRLHVKGLNLGLVRRRPHPQSRRWPRHGVNRSPFPLFLDAHGSTQNCDAREMIARGLTRKAAFNWPRIALAAGAQPSPSKPTAPTFRRRS